MKSASVVSFFRNVTVSCEKCRTAIRIGLRLTGGFFLASGRWRAKSRKRSGRKQMTNRVIDADGHICEPPAVWNDYVEKRYRADTIRGQRDPDRRHWLPTNPPPRPNL